MVDFKQKFHNTDKFRQAALHFLQYGTYTDAPRGTSDYVKYWDQETDRCLNGYTAEDGEYITGYHYFYLNYSPIYTVKVKDYVDRYGVKRQKRERSFGFPSFWDYDAYYFYAIDDAESAGQHMAVLKCRKRGYEQPYSELVATPNGFTTMGSLQVGDEVMNPDGKPTKVVEIFEQGYKDVYQLELADGRTVRCGADHLWEVICANNHFKHKIITTHDLMNSGLFNHTTVNGKQYNVYKYYLPAIQPVQYSEKQQNIHPYVLGALLGDGALTKRTPKISSMDQPILDRLQELLGEGFEFKYDPTTTCEYRIVDKERFLHKDEFKNGQYGVNRLHRWLEDLNLCVGCEYKYIPDQYKFGSVEQRIELVKGLMDTDGYISKDGSMVFANTSKQLIDDFVEVIRSLGLLCTVVRKDPASGGVYNGRAIFGTKFSYNVYIKGNPDIFYLPRKRNRIRFDRKFSNKVAIVDIKWLGEQEQQRCIMVDNPNHLYLTRDYIPTHNSFKGASMLVRNYELIPGSKNFAIASEQKFLIGDGLLTKAWAIMDFIDKNTAWAKQRLKSTAMERTSGFKVKDEFGKETEQGYQSSIIGITLKNDPERIRGTRGKLFLWEEAGKFDSLMEAWSIARSSLESDDGVAFGSIQIAFGTGGTEGSSFDGLKDMFYHPESYNIYAFPNIWDEDADENQKCGFFCPQWSNMEGFDEHGNQKFMDKDGNSLKDLAIAECVRQRKVVQEGKGDQQLLDRFVAERPLTPAEAILELGGNIFPRKLLLNQLSKLRTNTKLQSMKHVVDLRWDGNGNVEAVEKKSGDITTYPLKNGEKPEGSVVIWEYPIKDPPFGLYIAGCLPPGEKVLTQRGLINVEDVVLDDKLVSKDGNYVNIHNLQQYWSDGNLYKIKVANTYRTTSFTDEHPIYVSDTLFGEYKFVKAKKIKVGQYTKVPNLYYNTNEYIDAPHNSIGFWWLVGLWLGDGWCNSKKHNVSIVFDEKQDCYYKQYFKILENDLHLKYYWRKRRGTVEVNITCKQLQEWLTNTFGKYACGKRIPDKIKRMPDKYKLALLQGYLDSDGCICTDSKKRNTTEFVSINQELLEDIQDICFALQACGNITKMRSAKTVQICGRTCKQRKCYHLRLGHQYTCMLGKMMNDNYKFDDLKLNKINYTYKLSNHAKHDCICDGEYIYFKIKQIDISKYTGIVYNFECDTHTFICRNITTHNCDPYDMNESGTNSLGSVIIFKRFKAGEAWVDTIVAEYSGRPSTADEFYENVRKLLLFYNARCLYENEKIGIYQHFINKHCDYLLADQPDKVIAQIFRDSKVNRKKGCHMTKQVRQYAEEKINEWLREEYEPGHPNLERIYSEPLLEELIMNNGERNVDRVIALCMVMIYREELYQVKVQANKDENKQVQLFDMPLFGTQWWQDDSSSDDIPIFQF